MLYKFRYLFYGLFLFVFVMMFAVMFISLSDKGDPIGYGADKTDLNGVFTRFEGKIYASVPSNGDYEVIDADPASFKTIPDTYADAHIGYDRKHVYAGNMILEGLYTAKLRVLGKNYKTDGNTTY